MIGYYAKGKLIDRNIYQGARRRHVRLNKYRYTRMMQSSLVSLFNKSCNDDLIQFPMEGNVNL